jgi:hypothetical protein
MSTGSPIKSEFSLDEPQDSDIDAEMTDPKEGAQDDIKRTKKKEVCFVPSITARSQCSLCLYSIIA